eukprot:PhF_6_TR7969/c0_g1_i1/m.12120
MSSKDSKEKKSKDKDGSKEKKSKEKGSKDKGSKEKSKDSKEDGKDVKVVGSSRYLRKKVKEEGKGGKGKTKIFWILEGKTMDDKDCVFRELPDKESGGVYYQCIADDKTVWELPNLGGDDDPSNFQPQEINIEKKKFKERKEWKDEATKKPVINFAKRQLSAMIPESEISKDNLATILNNVTKEYMSNAKKLDSDGEKWMTGKLQEEVTAYLTAKRAIDEEYKIKMIALDQMLAKQAIDPNYVPKKPRKSPIFPTSPFVPQASYLRDPYYSKRVHVRNPTRSTLESTLEENLFFNPQSGEVKILYALQTKITSIVASNPPGIIENGIVTVVRDWAGGFAVVVLTTNADVANTFPLLQYVEFNQETKTLVIDGLQTLVIDAPEHVDQLELNTRLAQSAMFGDGSNDQLIVTSRAKSIEMAGSLKDMTKTEKVPELSSVFLSNVLGTATGQGDLDPNQRYSLRQNYLRYILSRDKLLQDWINIAMANRFVQNNRENTISLLLSVLEEGILHSMPSNDPQLVTNILSTLQVLRTDLPDPLKRRVEICKAWLRFTEQCINEKFTPRDRCETIPFEKMFLPVEYTPAHRQEEKSRLDRKTLHAANFLPPGLYLSLIIHAGDEILVHRTTGNLVSEIILQHATMDELAEFGNVDNPDFHWLLKLAGGNENWAEFLLQRYCSVYDNIGTRRFRGLLIRAVRRLREKTQIPTFGVLFDRPIVLPNVQVGHLLCVLHVTNKMTFLTSSVLTSEYEWKRRPDLEFLTYTRAASVTANARLKFMSTSYVKCERWIEAAIQHQNNVIRTTHANNRLPGGFYLGFFGVRYNSTGHKVLVPERNRTTLPLALVSTEFPSLEEWRWIQSLNESKRRVNSFGFHAISTTLTARSSERECVSFKHKFLRAVLEVKQAIGVDIDVFFDYEIVTLDENKRIKAVFATCRQISNPSYQFSGEEPMVWLRSDSIESQHFWVYWPTVYPPFVEIIDHEYIRAFPTCQPFTTDEVMRLNHDSCALHFYLYVDRLWFSGRWVPQLMQWFMEGCVPLVEKYDADRNRSDPTVRTVEEAVEVAVSNYSASLDLNLLTMRSLLMDASAAMGPEGSASALWAKLREVERVMRTGYSQRTTHVPPPPPGSYMRRRRTYDELLSDEETDDESCREATTYEVDCTLEELIFFNPISNAQAASVSKGVQYFQMQEIVDHIVDLACVECVDVGDVRQAGQVISNMISVIEAMDDLKDEAVVLHVKQQLRDDVLKERDAFQKTWLDVYKKDEELLASAAARPGVVQEDIEEDRVASELTAMYYDGSNYAITNVEQGVRICLMKAMGSMHMLEGLQQIAVSTQEALELEEALMAYNSAAKKHQALVEDAASRRPPTHSIVSHGGGPRATSGAPPAAPTIILVSQEYNEFPVFQPVDPNRCLVLKGVTGKIRFPSIDGKVMSFFAQFFNLQEHEISNFLKEVRVITDVPPDVLLSVALQLKTPLLVLRLAQILYGSPAGEQYEGRCDYFFTVPSATEVRNFLGDSFLFQYGIRDWVYWMSPGAAGRIIFSAMDVLWWIRFLKESSSATPNQPGGELKYTDHECTWLGVYAETRVKVFLTFGIHTLSREELQLWRDVLGQNVEYVSVRDSNVGDSEVEVLVACCPYMKSIDLSNTQVTDRGVRMIIDGCGTVQEVSLEGCQVSSQVITQLRDLCQHNRNKM